MAMRAAAAIRFSKARSCSETATFRATRPHQRRSTSSARRAWYRRVRAPPFAPLDGRAPLEKGRFHVLVHADDGNATARGQGTGQVPQAVDVDEIERASCRERV